MVDPHHDGSRGDGQENLPALITIIGMAFA